MRQVTWVLLAATLALVFGACSGKKKKSAAQIRREYEAKMLASQAAKRVRKRRVRPKMTPEKFAGQVASDFADKRVRLIDPQGRVYESPAPRWEMGFRFNASIAAYDRKQRILYGAANKERDVVALDLNTGRVRWRRRGVLRAVPKKADPKSGQKTETIQNMGAFYELTQGMLVVAQNYLRKDELWMKVMGLDARTGRVRWRKKIQNPWTDVIALWSEGRRVYLGDSSTGPVFLFDAVTGKTGKIIYPSAETYVFGGGDGTTTVYYHGRRGGELYLAGHGPDGKVRWRKALPDCYPNKAFFQPFVRGVLTCKAKTAVKEHLERVIKLRVSDGKILWQADVHKRKGDRLLDARRPDLINLKGGKSGAVYYRNRFSFVRVTSDGKVSWTYPLADKEIFIITDATPFRSDNVMGGDGPYEKVVRLDEATGKVRWEAKEPDGLPARGKIREGTLLLHGDTRIRVYNLATGKLLYTQQTPTRLEGAFVLRGTVVVDTLGVRQIYRLKDSKLLLYDRSEDETLVNTWIKMPEVNGLLLYHDQDHRLAMFDPVQRERKVTVPKEKIREASVLSPPKVEIDWLRWVDDDVIEFYSLDDERAWRVPSRGGKIVAAGHRKLKARGARGGLAWLGDPKKVSQKYALRVLRKGKEKAVAILPTGDGHVWSRSGQLLAFAERLPPTLKSKHFQHSDIHVRVYDSRRDTIRDVLHLKGAQHRSIVPSLSFGPGDRFLTVVVEQVLGSHYVGTFPIGRKSVGELKIDNSDGSIEAKVRNERPPTRKIGFDLGENFGKVAWSANGQVFAYVQGSRMFLMSRSGRSLLKSAESAVSLMAWSPRGATLIYVKDGNLYRWRSRRITQLTYFVPKREPRNEEEENRGNLRRFGPLRFSRDGRRLAVGFRWPYKGSARVAIMAMD